jgi:hypothetical protein
VNIEDLAKLGRAINTIMVGLGVSLGPVLPDTLVEEVGCLPGVIRELELSTARRAVHRVLAMFESHYQGLNRMALSSDWAPGISDTWGDKLEDDCASFAHDMADASTWSCYHKTHQRTRKVPGPRFRCIISLTCNDKNNSQYYESESRSLEFIQVALQLDRSRAPEDYCHNV